MQRSDSAPGFPSYPQSPLWQGGLILCLLITAGCEPARADSEPEAATSLTFSEGVLVLEDGRVFQGRIETVVGGYRVTTSGSIATIPLTKIRATAPTLHQAYLALRDQIQKPKADDHLVLAEWCLQQNLVGEARTEVAQALKLDPLRQDARLLMQQIDKLLNPEPERPKLPTGPAMTPDGFLRPSQQTVTGMTRETHQHFVRTIQPLLLNRCGNAYCHGEAAKNDFRLQNIVQGRAGQALPSQANLDQVLKYVDRKQPEASRLLTILQDPPHEKVFPGTRGAEQAQILTDWILALTAETRSPSTKPRTATAIRTASAAESAIDENFPDLTLESGIVPAAASQPAAVGVDEATQATSPNGPGMPPLTGGTQPQKVAHPNASERNIEQRLLETVRQQSLPDPFDPEIFNRAKHGATARELRERQTGKADANE